MAIMRKIKIIIFALLAIATSAVLLFLLNQYVIERTKKYTNQAEITGFKYAKEQCVKRNYPNKICNNLQSDAVMIDDTITTFNVYVYYHDNELFNSSMSVNFIRGKFVVEGYIQDR